MPTFFHQGDKTKTFSRNQTLKKWDSKILEAMEKLKAGTKFNEVAATYSEDKARYSINILAD